jgi:DNA-3-methyladenine glycosylase I
MARLARGLKLGADGLVRCAWPGADPLYLRYHDEEWGFPQADDQRLFEKLCLEGFQAGLSWLTILRKRESFRKAFRCFDPEAVARFSDRDVARLLRNAGIVRHRGKIESAINNARRAAELAAEAGSLARFFWSFEPGPKDRPRRLTWPVLAAMPTTEASIALGKALKRRGFSFVGPTTCYAFMQAMGLVNDHVEGCAFREGAEQARARFVRPGAGPGNRGSPRTVRRTTSVAAAVRGCES